MLSGRCGRSWLSCDWNGDGCVRELFLRSWPLTLIAPFLLACFCAELRHVEALESAVPWPPLFLRERWMGWIFRRQRFGKDREGVGRGFGSEREDAFAEVVHVR